jgi:drug/metabolite transporter (DMT)-like permease
MVAKLCRLDISTCEVVAFAVPSDKIAQSDRGRQEMRVGEWLGVLLAVVSSSLGGTAAAVTRYLVRDADPITLAVLRWAIGFLCLLPVALLSRARWPPRGDLPAVAALGLGFFGLFFVLYNIAIGYTTAARASLALSTLPLQTMVVGALLGIEKLSIRKSLGVGIAVLGVVAALASGLASAPQGAWRGELIMAGAVLCMAFYNVWSRPFMARSSAIGFLTVGMGAGAAALVAIDMLTGRWVALTGFATAQWVAGIYLGIGGGAVAFILWVKALQRATPTRVANTMTVNPIAAGLLATQLVGEPITPNLVVGLVAVFAGIWIATTEAARSQGIVGN